MKTGETTQKYCENREKSLQEAKQRIDSVKNQRKYRKVVKITEKQQITIKMCKINIQFSNLCEI